MVDRVEKAKEILKEETGELRQFRPFERYLFNTIAISWALFQLSLASFFNNEQYIC